MCLKIVGLLETSLIGTCTNCVCVHVIDLIYMFQILYKLYANYLPPEKEVQQTLINTMSQVCPMYLHIEHLTHSVKISRSVHPFINLEARVDNHSPSEEEEESGPGVSSFPNSTCHNLHFHSRHLH